MTVGDKRSRRRSMLSTSAAFHTTPKPANWSFWIICSSPSTDILQILVLARIIYSYQAVLSVPIRYSCWPLWQTYGRSPIGHCSHHNGVQRPYHLGGDICDRLLLKMSMNRLFNHPITFAPINTLCKNYWLALPWKKIGGIQPVEDPLDSTLIKLVCVDCPRRSSEAAGTRSRKR
jgi:hypothetical protein